MFLPGGISMPRFKCVKKCNIPPAQRSSLSSLLRPSSSSDSLSFFLQNIAGTLMNNTIKNSMPVSVGIRDRPCYAFEYPQNVTHRLHRLSLTRYFLKICVNLRNQVRYDLPSISHPPYICGSKFTNENFISCFPGRRDAFFTNELP